TSNSGVALMLNPMTVSNAVGDAFNGFSNTNFGNSNYRGQSGRYARFGAFNAWVNYVGRSNEIVSNFEAAVGQRMKMQSNGVQLGTDIYRTRCSQLGVMFGYEKHNATLLQDKTDADDYYFGLYGQRKLANNWDVRGVFGYGFQNYSSRRFASDSNLYTGSYDGKNIQAMLELGKTLRANRHLTYRPVVGFDLFHNMVDAYDSTSSVVGSTTNLHFNDSSLTQLSARIGSDFNWKRNRLGFNGGAYYSYMMSENGDHARVGFSRIGVADSESTLTSSDLGRNSFTFAAGTSYALNRCETVNLFGNYYGDYYVDRAGTPFGSTYMVGLQARF
ncbi:MAG: autotransporter outer membrane beta-barrel domain-containing protein, partial [Thermoguttaceae bacterium]